MPARYLLLAFLWTMALIAYVQRAAISVPLQEIGQDLALANPPRALGLLQSSWHLGYALFQLPAGRIADKFGGRRSLLALATLWSLATGLAGFARSYWELVAAWTLMGVAQAGAFPCAVRSIAQDFGDSERARASGWLGSGMLAGGAIAPLLTAALLEKFAPLESAWHIDRWRLCLVLYVVPGLLWVMLYAIQSRSAVSHAARTATAAPSAVSPPAPISPAPPVPPHQAWLDPSLWLLCGQQFFRAAAMVFFLTWFPTFLQQVRHVSLLQSGLLTTCTGVAAMLGALTGGYASDAILAKTGSKRLARQGQAVVGMALCSLLITLSYFITDTATATLLISLGAFVATFGGVAGYTVAIDFGGKRVGTVFGAMNMCGALGAMLFPFSVGWLVAKTQNWNVALFSFAALMAIDAVLWAALNPKSQFLEPHPAPRTPA